MGEHRCRGVVTVSARLERRKYLKNKKTTKVGKQRVEQYTAFLGRRSSCLHTRRALQSLILWVGVALKGTVGRCVAGENGSRIAEDKGQVFS